VMSIKLHIFNGNRSHGVMFKYATKVYICKKTSKLPWLSFFFVVSSYSNKDV
jgi:hypothetical protein